MRVESLSRLLNGILLNNPVISQVSGFNFHAKAIKRGEAFICLMVNQLDIDEALKNGAYAIITSESVKISDDEVAYIKVENIQSALFRLMRFFISQNGLKFFYVNAVLMAILGRMSVKNATLLPTQIDELFKSVYFARQGDIFFSDKSYLLEQLSPTYECVFSDPNATLTTKGSMFFINTICDGVYYQNLNISEVFLGDFCGLIKFLNQNNISFKISDFKNLGHFEPIFIDKDFQATSFGSTFRAVIVESDLELLKLEISYLSENFSQDDFIIAIPKSENFKAKNAFYFDNISEITTLKNFRYILVFSKKLEVLNALNQQKPQENLFSHLL